MDALTGLITRLEAVTSKLELFSSPMQEKSSNSSNESNQVSSQSSNKALTAWDEMISVHLKPLETNATEIGGIVADQFKHFKMALQAQRIFIETAGKCKKPSLNEIQKLIKPTQEEITQVIQIKDSNRPSPFFGHLSVLAEGIPALGWEPTPAPYISDFKEASLFYVNRVIKQYKDQGKEHVDFVNAFKELLNQLQAYVKSYHTTGLSWNSKGLDTETFAKDSNQSLPPPSPLPTPQQLEQFTNKNAAKAGGLLDELNSKKLTTGLRKVDKSEMTHKNPALRSAGIVKASDTKAASSVTESKTHPVAIASKIMAPPKCALEGNKWIVENFTNNSSIMIDSAELKQVVYIYNCSQCTIQITNKVNAVTIDNCKKSGVLVNSVVSTIDVVNSKSMQVQITGNAPTAIVDKTEGLQLFLSEESMGIEVFSAKSSGLNLLHSVNGEYMEKSVPEQLKSSFVNGKLVSVAVEHKG